MKKRLFLASVCATALLATASFQSSNAASLDDELQGLLASHPAILSAHHAAEAAKFDVQRNRGAFLPTLSVNADAGHEHINSPSERSSDDGDPSKRFKQTFGLELRQNLFDGYSRTATVRSSQLTKVIQEHEKNRITQSTVFRGIQAYIAVLQATAMVELARQSEQQVLTLTELEDESVDSGGGLEIDVLENKSRLQDAKNRRVDMEGLLKLAVDSYEQTFGHAPNLDAMSDPNPPLELVPETLDQAIDFTIKESPVLRSGDVLIEVAREGKTSARSALYPNLDVVGNWNYEKDNDATIGIRRDWSILLEASWTAFDGFQTQNAIKQSVHAYAQSQQDYQAAVRDVVEALRISWHGLETLSEKVELLNNKVTIKQEVFDATVASREAGNAEITEELDADNDLTNTRIEYFQSYYDRRLAVYALLFSMGRLSPEIMGMDYTG